MDNRKFSSGASASAPIAPTSPVSGYPSDGNPATATPATPIDAYWGHSIGEEIREVILWGGLTPNYSVLTQLRDAIIAGVSAMIASIFSRTGELGWIFGASAPAGWLELNGNTIGQIGSGATFTGANYYSLYDYLWTNGTDTTCPLLTSGGGASSRGASAVADRNSGKRLTLPNVASGETLVALAGIGSNLGISTAGEVISHNHNWGPDNVSAVAGSGSPGHGAGGIGITSNTGGPKNKAAGMYGLLAIHL